MTDIDTKEINKTANLLVDLISGFVRLLCHNPDAVEVNYSCNRQTILFEVFCIASDYGLVIGRKGVHANSVRDLVNGVCTKNGYGVMVEFISDGPKTEYPGNRSE